MTALDRLGELTNVLLRESATPDDLQRAVDELYGLFQSLSPIHPEHEATQLPDGRALSPHDAANCIRDPLRTATFLRGVNDAILSIREKPVKVVYAGTGPYAPLALPLMTRFSATDGHITLIDIHAAATSALTRLVDVLGFASHVRQILTADAVQYRGEPIHVGICEVMQRALTVEPQVAIYRNLAAQLAPGGVMVPQSVAIDLEWCSDAANPAQRSYIARAFELRAGAKDEPQSVRMPALPAGVALYTTRIQTYGRHALGFGESGLTQPEFVRELANVAAGDIVDFHYQQGSQPGLRPLVARPR